MDPDMAQVLARLEGIEARLARLELAVMDRELVETKLRGQGERIGALEQQVVSVMDDRRWVTRLLVAAVLAAVLSLVVAVPAY